MRVLEYTRNSQESKTIRRELGDIRATEITDNLTNSQDLSSLFAEITWERTCGIYERSFELLKPIHKTVLTDSQAKRKEYIESICRDYPSCNAFYISGDDELAIEKDSDWSRKWLTCGIIQGDIYIAICGSIDSSGSIKYYTGLRRLPGYNKKTAIEIPELNERFEESPNEWWYARVDSNDEASSIKYFEYLLSHYSNS